MRFLLAITTKLSTCEYVVIETSIFKTMNEKDGIKLTTVGMYFERLFIQIKIMNLRKMMKRKTIIKIQSYYATRQ